MVSPLLQILGAGAGMRAATLFGKELFKSWARTSGPEGTAVFNSVINRIGWGTNFVPFVGIGNMFIKGVLEGGFRASWSAYKGALESAKSAQKAMRGTVKEVLSRKWIARTMKEGIKTNQGFRVNSSNVMADYYSTFIKSMGRNPIKPFQDDIHSMWKQHLGTGFAGDVELSKITLSGEWLSGAQRAAKAISDAQNTSSLIGTHLMSNMAVVGFPTLTSGVATVGISRAIWSRMQRQMRGYEDMRY